MLPPSERSLRAQHAALTRWSQPGATRDQGRKITEAQLAKFEEQVDPDHKLDPDERRTLAERARRAHFADLARRSLKARRLKGAADAGAA